MQVSGDQSKENLNNDCNAFVLYEDFGTCYFIYKREFFFFLLFFLKIIQIWYDEERDAKCKAEFRTKLNCTTFTMRSAPHHLIKSLSFSYNVT